MAVAISDKCKQLQTLHDMYKLLQCVIIDLQASKSCVQSIQASFLQQSEALQILCMSAQKKKCPPKKKNTPHSFRFSSFFACFYFFFQAWNDTVT